MTDKPAGVANAGELIRNLPKLTRKDFASGQEVRWCPGCGDYSILAQMQKVLPELGIPKEKFVFVSGIGCSSRFPYYMNTYGIHSIHGRAPTIAAGHQDRAARSLGLGDHRRRRRPEHRRQPPDPRHPAQSGHQHHPVQQPHLRADEGAVLAHVRVREEDEVEPHGQRSSSRSTH